MKKRTLSLLLAAALSLGLLAGCAAAPGSTAPSTTPSTTSSGSTGSGSGPSGSLEIAVFSNGELMDAFWDAALAEYESLYPDVDVTLTKNPKIEESVRPRFVSGNPPDLYYMGGGANMDEAQLTQEGQFLDLTEWLGTAPAIGYDGLLKDSFSVDVNNTVDGKVYGLGVFYTVWGAYYNKAMAAQYGWEPPADWQEFLELAPKIAEKGIYPIIHQGKYPDYLGYGFMQPSIAANAGRDQLVRMANLEQGAYLTDEVRDAYEKYAFLRDNNYMPPEALALTHTEAQMEWLQGKAFILPCGNWLEGEMAADIPDGFEMGFIPSFWQDEGKKPVFVASGAHISVAANSRNPEAAKAFLQVLFSKNVVLKSIEAQCGVMPVREEYEGLPLSPSYQDIATWVNSGKVEVITAVGGAFEPYAEQRTATTNAIAAILGGQMTPQQAVESIEAECQRIKNDAGIQKVTIQ